MAERIYSLLSFFCGLGGKTLGFQQAETRLFGTTQRFRSIGGIDSDPEACEDFRALTGSPALCADLHTLTVEQLRAFAGDEAPDVVIGSPPCKGFSGLLSETKSRTQKYQTLNSLVFRWLELVVATWTVPPRLILLENVPRIQTRGATLLRHVRTLLHSHGYVSHGTEHDCGVIGNLAQKRKRFLLVARHRERVSSLLYQPRPRSVRACGEVLGVLPLPGDPSAGPLHALPRISYLNWIRLALIPPGGDWRDLPKPEQLCAASGPNVQDNKYIVFGWSDPARCVTGATRPGSGAPSAGDLRVRPEAEQRYGNNWFMHAWTTPARTVTGAMDIQVGALSVGDARVGHAYPHCYGVLSWAAPAFTVAGMTNVGTGAYSIADARITCSPRENSGAYGVILWDAPSYAVTGAAQLDNGWWSVSDPRVPSNPQIAVRWRSTDVREPPPFVPVLPTIDGTWHRPLTTLELAALQGLPTSMPDGSPLRLAGRSMTRWRERIGNAVPPPTARAIAEQMLCTLVQSDVQGFALSSGGAVWVSPANDDSQRERKIGA